MEDFVLARLRIPNPQGAFPRLYRKRLCKRITREEYERQQDNVCSKESEELAATRLFQEGRFWVEDRVELDCCACCGVTKEQAKNSEYCFDQFWKKNRKHCFYTYN